MSEKDPLVIHVVRQFLPNRGGLEDVVANLCRELPGHGYRARVVTLDRLFTDPQTVLPARETMDGIEVVRIPWRGSSRYPLAPSVLRHLGEADIVHVHAIDFFFDALAWGSILHRKPLLATTHGGFFHTRNHSTLKTVWFNTLTRLSATGYRRIACCSQADKRLFDRIAESRTVLVENGADTNKFADAASQAPVKGLITIGRFSANKQLLRLLDAMKVLAAHDPAWKLTIAGVPSDLTAAYLETAISARGIERNVELVIGASNDEIRALMGTASLFVSASDYEGFGLVAIEAMSAGLVPVLQPNDAYADLARRHDCVRLCNFEDAAGAAATIDKAFTELHDDGVKSRQAAMIAARSYAWPIVAERYAAIYNEILPPERGRRRT